MSLDETAWAEIRCAYEAGDETVSKLAARLRVSEGAIYRRARRDGWARRSKNKQAVKASKGKCKARRSKVAKSHGKGRTLRGASSSADLIKRLYNAMDAKLKRLEARMDSDEGSTAAESERETRELGSMIRSFEKVTAFAESLEERNKRSKPRQSIAPGDAERMRDEIAQRLERLCADREITKQPGDTE